MLRCQIYATAGRFEDAAIIAKGAAGIYSDVPMFTLCWALAEHRLGRTESALEIAGSAAEGFPGNERLCYLLACLDGALKRISEGKEWLARAFEVADDPAKLKLQALDQPELACVWRTECSDK